MPIDNGKLPYAVDAVVEIETNIDDMNPQDFQDLEERLFAAGALDVFFTPIIMKKKRPAVKLTCIAHTDARERLGEIILRYSTSIGVRWHEMQRMTLRRRFIKFNSSYGEVSLKLSSWGDELIRVTPEYEDVLSISRKLDVPIDKIRHCIVGEFYAETI